jgi:hypothetical protein
MPESLGMGSGQRKYWTAPVWKFVSHSGDIGHAILMLSLIYYYIF